jgi:hypothetical protein
MLWIHGSNLSVAIANTTGEIVRINGSGWSKDVVAGTSWVTDAPGGAMKQLSVSVDHVGASVVVRRSVQVQGYGTSALQTFSASLVDTFSAAESSVGGVAWNQSISTPSKQPWRAAIATELSFASSDADTAQYWLPHNGKLTQRDDVLQSRNTSDAPFDVELGQGYYKEGHEALDLMPFPVFVWSGFGSRGGGGLIVAPRLNDTTLAATARLNASSLLFRRFYNRLDSAQPPTSFVTHLGALRPPPPVAVARTTDDAWRDGLRFALAISPEIFRPVQELVTPAGQPTAISKVGMGLYTCARASDINVSITVVHAGASTLWDASFWWPYIGMFIPPVANASDTWHSNKGYQEQKVCSKQPGGGGGGGGGGFVHGQQVSAAQISRHLVEMVEIGVTLPLSYFNLFEFGQNVKWPLPPTPPECQKDANLGNSSAKASTAASTVEAMPPSCWKNSSIFIASQLSDAVVYLGRGSRIPSYTWQNAILLDPGVASYQEYLAVQAKRHLQLLGKSFKGVVVDRTDHTTLFAFNRDDKKAWCGAPCASMLLAWQDAAARVAAIFHDGPSVPTAGEEGSSEGVMLVNYAGGTRAELLRHADGIFSESGFSESGSAILNSIGLSAIGMPAVSWTSPNEDFNDEWMQHHLRMGVHPMAPVFAADHSLSDGSAEVNALFRDYGPLFERLRSTKWGLDRSAVISIDPPPSKGGPVHNVFQSLTPRSATAPWLVVLALADKSVDSAVVTLNLPFDGPAGCEVMNPGLMDVVPRSTNLLSATSSTEQGMELLRLNARVWRGCALLLCSLE